MGPRSILLLFLHYHYLLLILINKHIYVNVSFFKEQINSQHQVLYHRIIFFWWYSLLKLIMDGELPHIGFSLRYIHRNTSQIRDISVATQTYKITWATNIWMWRVQKYFVSAISCTSRCSTALVESETVSLSKVAIRVIPAYCTTTNLIHVPKYQKHTQKYQIPSQ